MFRALFLARLLESGGGMIVRVSDESGNVILRESDVSGNVVGRVIGRVSETFYFVEGGRAAEATSNNNKCIEF
jgi:hypothetical protein